MSSQKNFAAQKMDFSEADNFYKTIGDVSAEIGVPPHVLRFWESKFISFIKPHKRKGGHRYYSQADVDAIYDIKTLLYEKGFTIKGAQKYLKENRVGRKPLKPEAANDSSAIEQTMLFVEEQPQASIQVVNIPVEPANFIEAAAQSVDKIDPRAIKILLKELESIKKALEN